MKLKGEGLESNASLETRHVACEIAYTRPLLKISLWLKYFLTLQINPIFLLFISKALCEKTTLENKPRGNEVNDS